MLSNIQKWTCTEDVMTIAYMDGRSLEISCNFKELMQNKRVENAVVIEKTGEGENVVGFEILCTITIQSEWMTIVSEDAEYKQFFPHDLYRCIVKDINQDRTFDISYRKHLIYDYSQEHFNVVCPYEVTEKTRLKAEQYIRRHSTGKNNKPTGIVLDYMVIVVKGDNHFTYNL